MTGETDLNKLLASIQPELIVGEYVYATLQHGDAFYLPKLSPLATFWEAEGMTVVLRREDAEQADLDYVYPSRMITLKIHSSLEAVGFLAAIMPKLAEAGIPTNVFSAYYHDHLLVPLDRAEEALKILSSFR